jgi:predicted metal-dependent hydrolase
MRFMNRRLPRFSLASTIALEHLTALLARRILADDSRFTAPMDSRMKALWRWHALEESDTRRWRSTSSRASRRATRCARSRS